MPWHSTADVARHNKNAANDPALRKQWKAVANGYLSDHPDDEAGAIKRANGVVRKRLREQRELSNIISDAEILSEFNFRSLGHNIVNRTLAKMGSGKAQGRLDRQETLDKLMNMFNTFLAHQRSKPTYASLLAFLGDNFGHAFAVSIGHQIAKGTLGAVSNLVAFPQTGNTQAPAAAAPAAGGAASTPAAGGAASTPAAGGPAQNGGLNEASRFFLIEKPFGRAPNRSGRQTYDNGLDQQYSGRPAAAPQPAPAAPQPAVAPAAGPAPTTAAPGPAAGGGGGGAVPPAAPAGGATNGNPNPSNPNQLLSRKQLVQYFGGIASILLRQGKIDFVPKNKNQRATKNYNDSGYSNTRSEPILGKTKSDLYNKIAYKFHESGLATSGDKAVQLYLSLLKQNRSGKEIANALKSRNLQLSPEAIGIIHSAMGH